MKKNEDNKQTTKRYGLVVEDQPIAALIVKTLFLEQGCEVDVAENGSIAIDQARKYQYDFIIMDVGLPDMNGFEVTKNIRLLEENSKHKAFIIGLTAHINSEKKQLGLDAGMNIVLNKPLTREQAITLLNNFIPKEQS